MRPISDYLLNGSTIDPVGFKLFYEPSAGIGFILPAEVAAKIEYLWDTRLFEVIYAAYQNNDCINYLNDNGVELEDDTRMYINILKARKLFLTDGKARELFFFGMKEIYATEVDSLERAYDLVARYTTFAMDKIGRMYQSPMSDWACGVLKTFLHSVTMDLAIRAKGEMQNSKA